MRGMYERSVERRNVIRNEWMKIIKEKGMNIGEMIGGKMVIERIFGWKGVGRYEV